MQVQTLKALLTENMQSEGNPLGLLRGKQEQYLACLDVKKEELDALLKRDETHWSLNLEQARKRAGEANTQISALIARQQLELQALMN